MMMAFFDKDALALLIADQRELIFSKGCRQFLDEFFQLVQMILREIGRVIGLDRFPESPYPFHLVQ